MQHMADRPQGDLVGCRINTKHFRLGKTMKTTGVSSLHKKPYPTHASCGIQAHNLPVTQWWHNAYVLPALSMFTTQPMKCLPWIKKPILLMPVVGFKPTTSQLLNCGITSRLTHCLNHSATVDWCPFG